jgi:hypothetical protein
VNKASVLQCDVRGPIECGPATLRSILHAQYASDVRKGARSVGGGQQLFREGSEKKVLRLVETKTSSSGAAVLTYQPDKPEPGPDRAGLLDEWRALTNHPSRPDPALRKSSVR